MGLSLVKRTCGHLQRSDCPQSSRWGDIPLTLDESSYIAVWTASGWSTWHRARGQAPVIIEGSLEVKLPTIWTDGKAEVERVREEKRREEERRSEKRKSQKKEDVGAQKGRKVAKHCFFPLICGCGCGATWGDERWKIARRCGAKHISKSDVQKTPTPEPFSKLSCSKRAPRCGAKQDNCNYIDYTTATTTATTTTTTTSTTATATTLQPQLQLQLRLQLHFNYKKHHHHNYNFDDTSATNTASTTTTISVTQNYKYKYNSYNNYNYYHNYTVVATATTTAAATSTAPQLHYNYNKTTTTTWLKL